MKTLNHKLFLTVLAVLSIFILADNGWSEIGLPHANFDGLMETYLDNGTNDDLVLLYTSIFSTTYVDGTSGSADSILWSTVTITGAKRNPLATPGTTFTPATLAISDGTTTYLSATLKNIEFVLVNGLWRLNPNLDISNPSTINLENITLNPGPIPSQYILDLQAALGSQTIAGMTMTLDVFNGDITGNSQSVILEGLLDGVPVITNYPPVANAGENITITSDQIAATTIHGVATDVDGDALTCRWMEGLTVLQDWTPAGPSGECPLSLSALSLGLGLHTLTLEVYDGQETSSNTMDLTIDNSAPHAAPGGAGVYAINTPVILPGDVSDFDGDMLNYQWTDGTTVLCSGNIQSVAGGASVLLPDCVVSNLSLGMHTISLQVSDGFNSETKSVTVQIIDNIAPTLKPVANKYILWPPNHKMVNITIAANASDNSGCPVTLNAAVTSNEPEYGLGSGDIGPDWTQPVINQTTGMIYLQLRAERSGRGKGRKYTIIITATDCSGNASIAKVKIRVPHDKDNEDRNREDREEHDRDDRDDRDDSDD